MKKFVQTRLDPVLAKGYYSTILDPKIDSQDAKKIRDSFIYFRTSSKPSAVEGVDIDYLSMDEYDRVNAFAEASALESMSSSKYQIVTRWSTPSAPDMGIHRLFERSDQYWYLHKCEKCGHYNEMNYDEYQAESPIEKRGNILCVNPNGVDVVAKTVVEGSFQFVCQKCGQPLDRWYNGHWVPKFPDRTKGGLGTRGYMISQLNAVWVSADALKRKELESISKQAFYNYTLGYPYEDTKLKINENDIYDNRRSYLPKPLYNRGDYAFISVGIDWGNIHWVTVHGVKPDGTVDLIRLFNIVKPDSTDPKTVGLDVEKIILELTPYNPDIIVADIGDSGDKVARLIDHFGVGVVFGCKYPSTPRSTGQVKPTWNVQGNMVSADKLTQNKRYIAKIKEGRIGFYQDKDRELQLYANHWKNVVIRDEEDDKNEGQFYQTITRRGDDHYSQASVYGMLGYERLLDEHFGVDAYGLDTQWINDHVATPTDIYNQY